MSKMRGYLLVLYFIFPFYFTYASTLTIGTLSYTSLRHSELDPQQENVFFDFEMVLMKEICKRLHVNCKFEPVLFNQLSKRLSQGTIDLAIGSIIITPEKRKNYLFSLPYQQSTLQYITLSKSPLKTIQQLNEKTIGVHLHCPSRNFALKHIKNKIQLSDLPPSVNLLTALEKNKVSAILTHYHQAIQWVSSKKTYKLLGSKFQIGEGYGVMTQLGRVELMQRVNKALLDMEDDGTYLAIYQSYL